MSKDESVKEVVQRWENLMACSEDKYYIEWILYLYPMAPEKVLKTL
jgi:hypothetical protein